MGNEADEGGRIRSHDGGGTGGDKHAYIWVQETVEHSRVNDKKRKRLNLMGLKGFIEFNCIFGTSHRSNSALLQDNNRRLWFSS